MRSTKIIKNCSSSLCTCLHHMVILRARNKITDFLMILAWASPFKMSGSSVKNDCIYGIILWQSANFVSTPESKMNSYFPTARLDFWRSQTRPATSRRDHIIVRDRHIHYHHIQRQTAVTAYFKNKQLLLFALWVSYHVRSSWGDVFFLTVEK